MTMTGLCRWNRFLLYLRGEYITISGIYARCAGERFPIPKPERKYNNAQSCC